ncbi:MAG: hypothetical protein LBT23_06675 [Synergistaceae bacterium]|jgi:GGDEF domain-containing protein|nr:hypothetical protein [Synergistaceae bacterium]
MGNDVTYSVCGRSGKNDTLGIAGLILLPPVTIIPIVLAGAVLKGTNSVEGFPIPLAVAQFFIYMIFTIFAIVWRSKAKPRASLGASMVANGILIVMVTAHLDVNLAFGWVGASFLLFGLLMTTTALFSGHDDAKTVSRSAAQSASNGNSAIEKVMSAIPFPSALLYPDDKGVERVVMANDALGCVLGRVPSKMEGQAFDSMIPSVDEHTPFECGGAAWVPHRTPAENWTMFTLSPAPGAREIFGAKHEPDFVDPDTGLYLESRIPHMSAVLIDECCRYKRSLSVLLLRLDISTMTLVTPGEEKTRNAMKAFGKIVTSSVRGEDLAFKCGDSETVIFLPDYSQLDIKHLMESINIRIKRTAVIECIEIASARVLDASLCASADDIISAEAVIGELRSKIDQNKLQ